MDLKDPAYEDAQKKISAVYRGKKARAQVEEMKPNNKEGVAHKWGGEDAPSAEMA